LIQFCRLFAFGRANRAWSSAERARPARRRGGARTPHTTPRASRRCWPTPQTFTREAKSAHRDRSEGVCSRCVLASRTLLSSRPLQPAHADIDSLGGSAEERRGAGGRAAGNATESRQEDTFSRTSCSSLLLLCLLYRSICARSLHLVSFPPLGLALPCSLSRSLSLAARAGLRPANSPSPDSSSVSSCSIRMKL
jgi:hypothetical protein